MFNNVDKKLLGPPYFERIREEVQFIEVKSINTQHCWMIFKKVSPSDRPVTLYHKHHQKDPYYHKHYETKNVKRAIENIKSHDRYVIENRKDEKICIKNIEN